MTIKIASAQYDIGFFADWQAYVAKIESWVAEAISHDAKILVFPEYGCMELASLFGAEVYSSLSLQLEAMQTLHADFIALYQGLAQVHQVIIQPGTFPVRQADGSFHNRAYLFTPDGQYDYQDKLQMTRFENEQWFINSGTELKCFDTQYGRIAINVCYDCEFPLLARQQVEMGADLILVPSCTDGLAGYYRVRIGCQARALENQCYVVQSCTVGAAPWSEAVDVNVGAAGVFTPVDRGFPNDGILVVGELNAVQWVYAEVTLAAIATVRQHGQVFNYRDWPLQKRFV